MPQDGELCNEESFNSFLAGVLLTRKEISNFDFLNLMYAFEKKYNTTVVSVGNDIYVPIYFDDDKIRLYRNVDETIVVNGKIFIISEYLYSFTTPRVREFLGIPDIRLEKRKAKTFIKKLFNRNINQGVRRISTI